MKIKQVKLAQALPGTVSHLLEDKSYDMTFDKGMLTARHKTNKKHGAFVVFPANIAYMEIHEEITESTIQDPDQNLVPPKKGAKK